MSLSPNCGPRRDGARSDLVVIHYTGMSSHHAALERLCDPAAEVSAHWLISETGDTLALQGYEMQKTLSGQHSHLDTVPIAIFDNDQDIDALAARIADYAQTRPLRYGFLLRGHGLTCWGKDIQEARRQLEGLEFLFECELMRRRYEP